MTWDLLIIIPLGLAMGFITSVSGGGGVFGVPMMLAMGLPPISALALNRISDVGFLAGSLRNYLKVPEFEWKAALMMAVPLTIGSYIGAMFSVSVPTEFLRGFIIGAIFAGIAFLLYPMRPKPENAQPNYYAGIPALLVVGFWSGAVAMAGSTFAVLALVLFFHKSYLGGKAIDAVAAVPEALLSATILLMHSTVDIKLAAAMLISSIIGGYAGSHLAIVKGSNFVRFGMIAISMLMVAKVLLIDVLRIF